MKKFVSEFVLRGMVVSGFGPLVLAAFYLIFQNRTGIQTVSVRQVCIGIITLLALAFVAGGMNAIYQIERLPLTMAILIHGGVLYVSYLATYLINGWLESGVGPVLVFTGIFLGGYLAIWMVIYFVNRRRAAKLNEILQLKQQMQTE